jgi:hypothetical protein
VPTELVRYVAPGSSYLGSWAFQGPVTLQLLQQQLTGTPAAAAAPADATAACAPGSTDATRNCN